MKNVMLILLIGLSACGKAPGEAMVYATGCGYYCPASASPEVFNPPMPQPSPSVTVHMYCTNESGDLVCTEDGK